MTIPFVLLETVNKEYRVLKTLRNAPEAHIRKLAHTLQLYTPGDESVSRFRFSALSRYPGVSIDEHISNLLSCFNASMPISGPLPAILGEALELIYEIKPSIDNPPLMTDLVEAVDRVLSEKGYSKETNSDIRAALEVRIGTLIRGSVGKVLQCRENIPSIDDLVKSQSIIEFDHFSSDQSCLVILFLLTSLREYFKTVPWNSKKPRFIIIIEEAHNVVGKTDGAVPNADFANPKAFAAEYICRMLVELRALGVSIIIVDQHPSKVAPEVIKSTGIKLALQQIARDDREDLGAAMSCTQYQVEELARLGVGKAFLMTKGYHLPRNIQTVKIADEANDSASVAGKLILNHIKDDDWFRNNFLKRTECELVQLSEAMDTFDDQRLLLIQKLAGYLSEHTRTMAKNNKKNKITVLSALYKKALILKHDLLKLYTTFTHDKYTRLFGSDEHLIIQSDPFIQELRIKITNRFESITQDINKTVDIIDALIAKCKKTLQSGG